MQQVIVVADLGVEVGGCRESEAERGTFLFTVTLRTRRARWVLQKTYREFRDLRAKLGAKGFDLPDFPEWKLALTLSPEDLEERRAGLSDFLQKVSIRKDLLNSVFVREFLLLDSYCREILAIPPELVTEAGLDDELGLRDCVFARAAGVLLAATGDFNPVTRVGAYLTNMRLPWEEELPTLVAVGSIECWAQFTQGRQFKKVWSKIYPAQAFCMVQSADNLFVGLQNGTIDWLKTSPQQRCRHLKEVQELQLHSARVAGLFVDGDRKVLYSVGEDRLLVIFDYANRYKVAGLQHDDALTALDVDLAAKRLFLGNFSGEIIIYDIKNLQPQVLKVLCLESSAEVSALCFDNKRGYLFCAEKESGTVSVFLVEEGKQKLARRVGVFQGKGGISCLAWSGSRKELLLGHSDGTVLIWDVIRNEPLFMLVSDQTEVTKLVLQEEQNLLTVIGRKAVLRTYKLPRHWRDPKVQEELTRDAEVARKTHNMLKVKEAVSRKEEDSDEDDLRGWAESQVVRRRRGVEMEER